MLAKDVKLQEAMDRLRAELVGGGQLDEAGFARLGSLVGQYRSLQAQHGWPPLGPVVLLESNWPHLPAVVFFRAWAAWQGCAFRGVRELYTDIIPALDPNYFEPRALTAAIPKGVPLGETLVLTGALTPARRDEALALQRDIQTRLGARVLLGSLLLAFFDITAGEYYQALSIHFGVPFQGVTLATAESVRRTSDERSK